MSTNTLFTPLHRKIHLLKLETLKKLYPKGTFAKMQFGISKNLNFWFDKRTDNGFILGFYEEALRTTLQNLIKPGMVFYDLGAHWGYFSLIGSQLTGAAGKVYAFEALPHNYQRLVKNREINHIQNLMCYNMAVSDKKGTVRFSNSDDSFANTYLNTDNETPSIEVNTINLDEFVIVEGNSIPNIIKIDVEGAEYDVLYGAKEILKKHKPILHLSTHELHKKGVDKACRELLSDHGYVMEVVAENKNGLIKDYICN